MNKKPRINIRITVSKEAGKLSIRMDGKNFNEVDDVKDLPEDQAQVWETALKMLAAADA